VAVGLYAIVAIFVGLNARIGEADAYVVPFALDGWLALVLIATYTVWVVLLVRGLVSAATGAGFLVAGLALAARVHLDFRLAQVGRPFRASSPIPEVAEMASWVLPATLVAFAFGLATCAAACLWERRVASLGGSAPRASPHAQGDPQGSSSSSPVVPAGTPPTSIGGPPRRSGPKTASR